MLLLAALIAGGIGPHSLSAAPRETAPAGAAAEADWPAGSLDVVLARPTSLALSESPVRDALGQIAKSHDLPIWLDRRVDPSRSVDLELSEATLGQAVKQIAGAVGADVAIVGPIVYVGPPSWAAVARTSAVAFREQLAELGRAERQNWVDARVWKWPELTTPADLIVLVQSSALTKIGGSERVPYDLWPALDLGRSSPCDVLTLVALQFGLRATVQLESGEVQLVPLDP
ncbi:MAG: hypothetical protein KDA63_19025, partial [Planctomycetales bacterium]|nr:hypothetical protein [Planctomycetales bacterium]